MRAREALEKHREEIRRIVHAHKAENPRVFGSVATGTDDEDSDLDILIDPTEEMDLFDLTRLGMTLEDLLARPVDIASSDALDGRVRDRILMEARPL